MSTREWIHRWCAASAAGLLVVGTSWSEEVSLPVAIDAPVAIPVSVVEGDPVWTSGAAQPITYDWQPCGPAADSCQGNCSQHAGCGSTAPNQPLFGCIAQSDACFSDFVSPISNPLFFEDPRTLSEVRVIFANHWIPDSNPVFNGGNVQFLAAQVRIALTERLSIIATKDGYLWIDGNNEAAIPDSDGWADVAAGLKYNLVRDPESQFLLSVGTVYELDVGSHKVFQGNGDGEFHIFTTMGAALGEKTHWISGSGFRLPTDTAARSQMWYWSNHLDHEVVDDWYAVLELNWFHWMQSGKALPVNFEGGDIFNLGSTDVGGNDIVTMAVGAKKKFGAYNELGVGYEFPITDRKDLLQSRLYVDLIVRY